MKIMSCIKMLVLSLAFTAIHFDACPMEAPVNLKESLAQSLAEQRISSWWKSFAFGSGESVESFFSEEPKQAVFDALFELGEYGHAVFILSKFLNKPNGDIRKGQANDYAWQCAVEGNFPVINVLVDACVACHRKSPQLMSFNALNNMVSLIILGLISIEKSAIQLQGIYKIDDIKAQLVKKYKALLKEFMPLAGSEKNPCDFYQERFQELVPLIDKDLWKKSSSLWMSLASFDGYGRLSFAPPMQGEIKTIVDDAHGDLMASAANLCQSMMDVNVGSFDSEEVDALDQAIALLDIKNIEDFLSQA